VKRRSTHGPASRNDFTGCIIPPAHRQFLAFFCASLHTSCKSQGGSALLDPLDRALLAILQEDNLATADTLAEQVGRSPSAVARRLRRLRTSGAIAADAAILSEAAIGSPLSAVVHIQLERHAPQEGDRLRRRLIASPNVQLCLDIAGSFDILLLVVARDMRAYNDFADAMLAEHPAVRRFETSFVKKRVKASLAYPLEELLGSG
jgi:Lrp/AsnC family transcriptional regulator, leucine-responsive regulatory protein